jgi:hypothetical protein
VVIHAQSEGVPGAATAQLAADDQEAIKILRGASPVAWRDVNLIGNFDFAARTSQKATLAGRVGRAEHRGRDTAREINLLDIQFRHHAGRDGHAEIFGAGVPGCQIGRFQRHGYLPAVAQEKGHRRQNVANSDRFDISG